MTADQAVQLINDTGRVVQNLLDMAFWVVGVASAIAALTPTPADDHFLSGARQVLDALACNWGHARNASDKAKDPS